MEVSLSSCTGYAASRGAGRGEAVVSLGCAYASPKILKISYSDQFFIIYVSPYYKSMHPQDKCILFEFCLACPLGAGSISHRTETLV